MSEEEARALISKLTRTEKETLLQLLKDLKSAESTEAAYQAGKEAGEAIRKEG